MKLLIKNHCNYHYEIIESILVKYHEILGDIPHNLEIFLDVYKNISFQNYIQQKYPNVQFKKIQDFDYSINCTIYDKNFQQLDTDLSNNKYISHEITNRLQKNPNVFFLTPLSKTNYIYTDILPFSENMIKTKIPVYIIQGNLNGGRRHLDLLKDILNQKYQHKFIIKLLGRGYLPNELNEYKNQILLKNNLDFIDYHKEFLDGYCILPLISKDTHPQYYTNKLTSTINYARAYNLKCILDENLQSVYKLKNVIIYKEDIDIRNAFQKTLDEFYKNN